eukprot:sb/3475919/
MTLFIRFNTSLKVVLRSRESVRDLLGKAARLKESEIYRAVFIAPDRTLEERVERRSLVAKLRERREVEPEKLWSIRRGSIVETAKTENNTFAETQINLFKVVLKSLKLSQNVFLLFCFKNH